ncbi:MAG: site-specific integrase [Eubacterium sp.]|nr:site-specific integrase [Eubacterium sp.]
MEKNNAQARKQAKVVLDARAAAAIIPKNSLKEALDAYLLECEKTIRKATAARNRTALTKMVKILGEKKLMDSLTASYIRSALLQQGKSEKWMNNYIKRFNTFIRWAYRNDYISSTSCIDKLEPFKPKVSHKEEIMNKYLSTEELKSVLDNCVSEQWKLAIEFLSLTGMRFGEFAALRADDFSDSEITVQRTYNPAVKEENAPKTYNSFRKLHIQPELAECIKRINLYIKKEKLTHPELRCSPYWFPNPDGKHISNAAFDKYFKKLTKEVAGRELTAHALRHTHASLLFEKGLSLDAVSRRLGHGSNSRVTREVYLHITENLQKKDAAALDKISLL